MINLEKHLQRYVRRCEKQLLVIGFNSGRYDLNMIKSYLFSYLVRNKEEETSFIKTANGFFFQFGDTPFFDIWKFLDGASIQFSFLKAYRASVINVFLPDEWLHKPGKLDFPEL